MQPGGTPGLKTRSLSSVGLAILFLASLAGFASQLADVMAIEELPLATALWLAALVASGAGLGFLAARGSGRESSGHGGRAASAVTSSDLLEKVPIGLAVYEADGQLAFCNGLWRSVLADAEGFLAIGGFPGDDMRPAAGDSVPASDKSSLAGERQLDDGTWVRFDEAKLNDGGIVVSVRDVTDHHMRVAGAQSERERSRLIISAVGAWIWETDVLHRFSLAIPVRSEVTRDDLGWLIGRGLAELAASAGGGGDAGLSKCIESMQAHRRLTDARLVLHDGAQLHAIRLSGVPRIDIDGVFLGYCGVGIFDALPAAAAEPPPAARRRRGGPAVSLGQRVLLVDDSQTNRMLGVSILQKMGYECDAVANGRQAVDAVRDGTYGLVLMDIRMPEMDGFEATSQIRALSGSGRSIPVVAMTAHVNAEDRQICLERGMDDHVSKPVDRSALSSVLHRLIGPPDGDGSDGDDDATTAADAAADDEELVDHAILEQLRNDAGPVLVSELIASFMTETDDRLLRMQTAMKSGDFDSIAAEAHAMKSSSGTFGALRLQRLVERLEAAAAADDVGLASELLDQLPDMVAKSWCEFARAGYPPPM